VKLSLAGSSEATIYSSPEERDELETRGVIKAFAQHIKEPLKESSPHPSEG